MIVEKIDTRIKLLYVFIFIAFLMSMRCWISFGGNKFTFTFLCPVAMAALYAANAGLFRHSGRYAAFAILVFISNLLTTKTAQNLNGWIYMMAPAISIYLVLCIADERKEELLSYIVKWFGWMIMIGLPIYLISLYTTLPSLGVVRSDYGSADVTAGDFYNYIVYIKQVVRETDGIPRFNSAFIEPGDLGCVCSFMLMACQFEFKRYKYLIWVLTGLIASFSLAGWIMTFIAYLLCIFNKQRISFNRVIWIFILLLSVCHFGMYWNNGDNAINEAILSRLQSDEEKGFSGNNRTSLLVMEYFVSMFDNVDILLWGYDAQTIESLTETGAGAGLASQMIRSGLIGTLSLFWGYLYMALRSTKRRYSVAFFVLFLLFMFQRTDAFWISLVLCYVFGITINESNNVESLEKT